MAAATAKRPNSALKSHSKASVLMTEPRSLTMNLGAGGDEHMNLAAVSRVAASMEKISQASPNITMA